MVGVDIAQQIRANLSTESNDGGFELKEFRDKLGDEFYEVFPEKKQNNSDRMQNLQRGMRTKSWTPFANTNQI